MRHHRLSQRQHGASLVVGLIMLAVITLTVTAAFTLSNTNLKSVGNMQFRNEATAAANKAIEQVLGSSFIDTISADEIQVDINNDGTYDYTVQVSAPVCVRSSLVPTPTSSPSPSGLVGSGNSALLRKLATPNYYYTLWDIAATVTDTTSGASITIHQGIRYTPVDAAKRNLICS